MSSPKSPPALTKRLIEDFLGTTRHPINAYNDASEKLKELFHLHGKAMLRQIAKDLGYESGNYAVCSNKGGIAGSGEITLHTDDLYIQFAQSCGQGLEILYRTCKDRKDYSGGHNHWLSFIDLRDYESTLEKFSRLKARGV